MKQDATTQLAGTHGNLPGLAAQCCGPQHHNTTTRSTVHQVQGFAPNQWAVGRDFGPDGRLFKSEQGVPLLRAEVKERQDFYETMNVRKMAEDIAKSQASYQLRPGGSCSTLCASTC